MEANDRAVRKFVFDYFLENSVAPVVPEIGGSLGLAPREVDQALRTLDETRHLKLLEGTSRILMAFPFSAVASPFRVRRSTGQRYYANCAWDAIAFHPMLGESIEVESFCDPCGKPIDFRLEGGRGVIVDGPLPTVRIGLPASRWWTDITRTCSNSMVFLGAEEFDSGEGGAARPVEPGLATVDQMVRVSRPIYSGKLRTEYERPSKDTIQRSLSDVGLTGAHWEI